LLPADENGHILVLNDKILEFSTKLCQYYNACKIVACTPSEQSIGSESVQRGLKILPNLGDPSLLIIGREHKLPVPWTKVHRVFWFADFDNDESISEQVLLQKFLEQMAIKMLSEPLFDPQVIMIMKNPRALAYPLGGMLLTHGAHVVTLFLGKERRVYAAQAHVTVGKENAAVREWQEVRFAIWWSIEILLTNTNFLGPCSEEIGVWEKAVPPI
jgi:hypothetical protein